MALTVGYDPMPEVGSGRQPAPQSEFIRYQTKDGRKGVQCHFDDEALHLTQIRITGRLQTTVPNTNRHLKATYAEGGQVAANAGDVDT